MKLAPNDVHCLRHMLGACLDRPRKEWGFRNYFCADASGADRESMERLLKLGLVSQGERGEFHSYYHATKMGMDLVGIPGKADARRETARSR